MLINYITIDTETWSSRKLDKEGLDIYAPDCIVIVFAYAICEEPPKLWIPSASKMPDDLSAALTNPAMLKVMHNASFDLEVLRSTLNIHIPDEHVRDTAAIAGSLGLPRGLGHLSQFFGLGEEGKNIKRARYLLGKFTRASTKRPHFDYDPNDPDWREFCNEYALPDVSATRKLFLLLYPKFHLSKFEQMVWELDLKINRFGAPISEEYTRYAMEVVGRERTRLLEALGSLTRVKNPNSTKQLGPWLAAHGYRSESQDQQHIAAALEDGGDPELIKVLELKQALAHSASAAKLLAVMNQTRKGRLRHRYTPFATITGRWVSKGAQLHNLSRHPSVWDDNEIHNRNVIQASPACSLVQADFSGIEARISTILAGEKTLQTAYDRGDDPYVLIAATRYGIPSADVTKEQRQLGKVLLLAASYGMGAARLQGTAVSMGVKLTEKEAEEETRNFRRTYSAYPRSWRGLEIAALNAVLGGRRQTYRGITFDCVPQKLLRMQLPSGRRLHYWKPEIVEGKYDLPGLRHLRFGKGWQVDSLYGSKLFENAVQAIARDCLCVAMLRADWAKLHICLHTHDEIVLEEAEENAEKKLRLLIQSMEKPMPWMPQLVLKAEGHVTRVYGK